MTRKDFELIAGVIRDLHRDGIVTEEQRQVIASTFAVELPFTNDGFLAPRFMKACRPRSEV